MVELTARLMLRAERVWGVHTPHGIAASGTNRYLRARRELTCWFDLP
jgi:hypothetical protein